MPRAASGDRLAGFAGASSRLIRGGLCALLREYPEGLEREGLVDLAGLPPGIVQPEISWLVGHGAFVTRSGRLFVAEGPHRPDHREAGEAPQSERVIEDVEDYDPEPIQLNLAGGGGLDPELERQLADLPEEDRRDLAEVVRQAIVDIDFAEWESEMES